MKIRLLYYITLMGLAAACTQELDIAVPTAAPQLVLNGLLHPDSTIRISLTTTLPSSVTSTDFPVVDNAIVQLYEDDKLLSNLVFQDSVYVLDYYPKAGQTYTVEADVAEYGTVRASDVVPSALNVEVCFREDTTQQYSFFSAVLNVAIDDPVAEQNFYWLDIISTHPEYSRCRIKDDSTIWTDEGFERIPFDTIVCEDNAPPTFSNSRQSFYRSYSPIPDRFNAYVDNTLDGVTEYEGYMRVEDATLNGEIISFSFAAESYDNLVRYPRIHEALTVTARITNASQHYDRYLKSSVIYYFNRLYSEDDEIGFKPFVQSSQVYSNVENGTGIFAAYNTTSIRIEQHPCE